MNREPGNMNQELDVLEVPLEGTALVESGAGTGKTHAISALYLRFLLEKGWNTSEILVVTFTRAATEELKGRIRSLIREAVKAFSGETVRDPLPREIARRCKPCRDPVHILTEALRGFDEAAIHTIHGFCGRFLSDHAFESGGLFDTELVTDTEDALRETVCDFWRRHLAHAAPEVVQVAVAKKLLPDELRTRAQEALKHPGLRVLPPAAEVSLEALDAYRLARQTLKAAWPHERSGLREMMLQAPLNGNKYGSTRPTPSGLSRRERMVDALLVDVDRYLEDSSGPFPPPQRLEMLCSSCVEAATLKNRETPRHPIFLLCDKVLEEARRLQRQIEALLLSLQARFLQEVGEEVRARIRARNRRTYDQLVLDARAALSHSPFPETPYQAALVDEFQDTDPAQFEIFRRLFTQRGKTLFLIGDPKQAIYGFRGADLHTYLRAASQVPTRYTLTRNWRSDPELIRAVNAVFSRARRPFVYEQIAYPEAIPAEGAPSTPLRIEEEDSSPFILWITEPDEDATFRVKKEKAHERIAEALVKEIGRLVALGRKGKALLGEEPLGPRHVGVLVRTNEEARMVEKALQRAGIPAVLYSADNLFHSREAGQAEILLRALLEPEREGRVRAALVTDMMGLGARDLESLTQDEAAWEGLLERMAGYRTLWEEKGFLPMFFHFLRQEGVAQRLVALPEGERRLTNVLHLAEVLHRGPAEAGFHGPRGTLQWLRERRDPGSNQREEDQLRLERDEEAVKILTLHRSKGLEFPVVFCPFAWGKQRKNKGPFPVLFHDMEQGGRITLDLGSAGWDASRRIFEMEDLAESLRLLYVGLTRARNRCYVAWGPINQADTSAPAYLFHQPPVERWEAVADELSSHMKDLSPDRMRGDLKALERDSGGAIQVIAPPGGEAGATARFTAGTGDLAVRAFSGSIRDEWQVASFSSLLTRRAVSPDLPDHDEGAPPEPMETDPSRDTNPATAIFAFPKGTRAGLFFHDLLERVDFTQALDSTLAETVVARLRRWGFDPSWKEAVCEMVRTVLSVPLDPAFPGLRLEAVGSEDRLCELEFLYPLRRLEPGKLVRAFSDLALPAGLSTLPTHLEGLRFEPARGFMKGFMDLVFRWQDRYFLVDWKSNHLGDRVTDYDPASLAQAMSESLYVLQYLIYTVALDRYLSLRVPGYRYETHFGGVYYIFLRGVHPNAGPQYGIYRDRPAPGTMDRLKTLLLPQAEETP